MADTPITSVTFTASLRHPKSTFNHSGLPKHYTWGTWITIQTAHLCTRRFDNTFASGSRLTRLLFQRIMANLEDMLLTLSWAKTAIVIPSDICDMYSGMIDVNSRYIYLRELRNDNLAIWAGGEQRPSRGCDLHREHQTSHSGGVFNRDMRCMWEW